MGIQSTQTVSRRWATKRIRTIIRLAANIDYKGIEGISFEPGYDVSYFVSSDDSYYDIIHIDKWTNRMLEDVIDRPFYRRSMFDNYHVVDEVD